MFADFNCARGSALGSITRSAPSFRHHSLDSGREALTIKRAFVFALPDSPDNGSERRMTFVRVRCRLDQLAETEDRRFVKPSRDKLHVDRKPFRAEAKRHREARQTSEIEGHGCAHHVCGWHPSPLSRTYACRQRITGRAVNSAFTSMVWNPSNVQSFLNHGRSRFSNNRPNTSTPQPTQYLS